MFRKLEKLACILRNPLLARGLLVYGVAGAVEHSNVIAYVRPRHLIDVGANKGQFAIAAFALDPNIQIDCFEPFPASAAKLERWAKATSPNIRVRRMALAANKGTAQFYVTTREDSSSLFLPAKPQQEVGISVKDTIVVPTDRLDSQLKGEEILRPSLLKIDVQGGELDVLKGVGDLQEVIDYVYLEVSFMQLYKNQPLFENTHEFLEACGYRLRGIANADVDSSFGPRQADALYCR